MHPLRRRMLDEGRARTYTAEELVVPRSADGRLQPAALHPLPSASGLRHLFKPTARPAAGLPHTHHTILRAV